MIEYQKENVVSELIAQAKNHWQDMTVNTHIMQDYCYICEELENLLVSFGDAVTFHLITDLEAQSNAIVRERIAYFFGAVENPLTFDSLVTLLGDEDWNVRSSATVSLSKISHPDSLEKIVIMLQDTHPVVRRIAVEAVAEIGSEKTAQILYQVLTDPDEDVRNTTFEILGVYGTLSTISLLENIMQKDTGIICTGKPLKKTALEAIQLIKARYNQQILLANIKYSDLRRLINQQGNIYSV